MGSSWPSAELFWLESQSAGETIVVVLVAAAAVFLWEGRDTFLSTRAF